MWGGDERVGRGGTNPPPPLIAAISTPTRLCGDAAISPPTRGGPLFHHIAVTFYTASPLTICTKGWSYRALTGKGKNLWILVLVRGVRDAGVAARAHGSAAE